MSRLMRAWLWRIGATLLVLLVAWGLFVFAFMLNRDPAEMVASLAMLTMATGLGVIWGNEDVRYLCLVCGGTILTFCVLVFIVVAGAYMFANQMHLVRQ